MSGIWNLSSICRFCHCDGNFRTFTLPNLFNGILESYGDMLQKTFNISMTIPTGVNASNMICDNCITRLTDAATFKCQVQACEDKFQQYVKNEFFTLVSDVKDSFPQVVKIESNDPDNSANIKVDIELDTSLLVKIEKSSLSEYEDYSSIPDNNYDDNYTPDENIVKPDVEPVRKDNLARKGQTIKRKNFNGKKIKKIGMDKQSVTNRITCVICYKNLPRIELLKHIKTHRKPYNCTHCEGKFYKYGSISTHIQKEHGQLYKCNFCNQSFKTEASLLFHLEKHTRQKVFECDICHRQLKAKTILIRHIKTHDPARADKRYECPQCLWKFANNTNMMNHIKTVHDRIKNYHCTICPKSFAAKKNLEIHIRTHTNERPYECSLCQKKFKVSEHLQRHKKIHHKIQIETAYKCKTCNIKFDHRGIYVDHLKTHPEVYLVCDLCGQVLSCEKSMKRHKLTHNPRLFKCDLCDKTYKSKLQVTRHIKKVHLNIIKKSKCDVCGKLIVDLKQHQLTHDDRRFACTMCHKAFGLRNQLKRHLSDVHFNAKLYGCDICGKRYNSKGSLLRHTLKCRI